MSTTTAELEAILHGAAVAPVARGFLRITGSDATRWLNGMVTNSVQSLAPGEGNYNFILNAQGRIQGDCMIYRETDQPEPIFLLETDISQVETIRDILDRFVIMDDVEMEHFIPGFQTLLLLGPKAAQVLKNSQSFFHDQDLSGTLPAQHAVYDLTATRLFTPPPILVPAFELWDGDGSLEIIKGDMKAAGAVAVSPAALEAFRVYSGTPRYGTDIRNSETARDLPQETNQTHALHFAKGCYLGQEIVERIRSRGQIHRLFTRFRLEGDLPINFPAPLESDGKPAGELTSAAIVPLPEGPQIYALGYARREFLELKKPIMYAGGTATPAPASQRIDTENQ